MAIVTRKIHPRIRQNDVQLDLSNPIARKLDFYAPTCRKDIVGDLEPIAYPGHSTAAGKHGKSSAGDGGNSWINYGDVHDLGANDISFGCWYKTTDTQYGLIGKSAAAATDGRYYLISNGGTMSAVVDTGAGLVVDVTDNWNDGYWHFACVTVERGGSIRLYIDGKEQGSTSGVGTASYDTAFEFGLADYQNASGVFASGSVWELEGYIQDAFIAHSLLSPFEVRSLYTNFGQIWEPYNQLIDVTDPAGASINATTDTFTLTTYQATISTAAESGTASYGKYGTSSGSSLYGEGGTDSGTTVY